MVLGKLILVYLYALWLLCGKKIKKIVPLLLFVFLISALSVIVKKCDI